MENKDFEYPIRSIRLADDIWEKLWESKEESHLSWNLFIDYLLNPKKPRYGNSQINELIDFLKEKMELEVLDESIKMNRRYAYLCLKKFGFDEIKSIILKAKNNDFWSSKIVGFKSIYYNGVKIQRAENNNFIKKI